MRVNVPFAYTVRLQSPVSKKIEDVVRAEMIEHDIPEIRTAETELVATWGHKPSYRTHSRKVECRTYCGDYYYESGEGRSLADGRSRNGGTLPPGQSLGLQWYDIARHAWFYDGYKQGIWRDALAGKSPRPRAKSAREIESDREIELEKAVKGLSDLIIIDDVLWCRARAPRISLSIGGDGVARYGAISIAAAPMPRSPAGRDHPMEIVRGPDQYRFRLDEVDAAEEFARRMGINCENQLSDISIAGNIEMGMHPETWLTLKRAKDAVDGIGAKLGNLPADIVSMWLDLRSIVSTSDAGLLADDVDALLQTLDQSLRQHGYVDPTLSKYFDEIEIMRSVGVKPSSDRSWSPGSA